VGFFEYTKKRLNFTNLWRKPIRENVNLNLIDVERLKKREQTGLDTLVAFSLNTGCEKRYEL